MNIGIFTHDLYPYKPWGQGRYVYDLVRHLRKIHRGKIYVFSPSEGIHDPFHIQIIPGSHQGFGKNISFSVKLGFILEKLIRKYKLDIVHFQGGPGGLFLLQKPSVPVLFTVHHTYFQQSRYIKSQRWKRLLYLWEKYSYFISDYLLCDSDSTREIILKHYGIGKKDCQTMPIGVDRNQFNDLGHGRIPNSLFFLGRLEARKGIDFLIKAMPGVKDAINDVVLFIGGEGILKSYIQTFVATHHLESNVVLLGHIADSDLIKWYNKVDAVVIPSIFEGFGLTAIEAMACGAPVVATDVDALRDIIDDGIDGRLIQYGDVGALSRRITDLLSSTTKQRRFTKAGIQKVTRYFDWDTIAKKVVAVYFRHTMENAKTRTGPE